MSDTTPTWWDERINGRTRYDIVESYRSAFWRHVRAGLNRGEFCYLEIKDAFYVARGTMGYPDSYTISVTSE